MKPSWEEAPERDLTGPRFPAPFTSEAPNDLQGVAGCLLSGTYHGVSAAVGNMPLPTAVTPPS